MCAALGGLFFPALAADERIALLKGNDVLLAGADGQLIATLSSDQRAKSELRWLPDGQWLSYQVEDTHGAKARLVVVDLAGKIAKEIPIRPETDPPTEGLRFVEDLSWVTARKVRVSGSVNPIRCEMFDLDIETAQESNWQMGECGSFIQSPDGKHFAYVEGTSGAEDERRDSVGIDDDKVAYSDGGRMRVLAGPVWSKDSSGVAVLEKRAGSGELDVTTVSITGRSASTPVPQYLSENPSLVFVDTRVVVRSAKGTMLVDPRKKSAGVAPEDVRLKVEQADRARETAAEAKRKLEAVTRRLGAREGVAWPGVTKN